MERIEKAGRLVFDVVAVGLVVSLGAAFLVALSWVTGYTILGPDYPDWWKGLVGAGFWAGFFFLTTRKQ